MAVQNYAGTHVEIPGARNYLPLMENLAHLRHHGHHVCTTSTVYQSTASTLLHNPQHHTIACVGFVSISVVHTLLSNIMTRLHVIFVV